MNARQKKFVQEYLKDPNATQAAIRAGYSAKTAGAIGSENLTKLEIASAIAAGQAKVAEKVEVSAVDIALELKRIGFSNMGDYVTVTPSGNVVHDFTAMDAAKWAPVQELTVDEYTDGKGEEARPVKRVRFKLADKRGALVDLGKHIGMWPTRVEHTGRGGGPIEHSELIAIADLPPDQREQLRAILLGTKRPAMITDVEAEEVEE